MSDKTTIDQVPKESPGSQPPVFRGTLTSFQGWTVLRQFPAKGGEADVYLVEKGPEKRVLKMYRYGISPAKEVFERLSRISCHSERM